MPFENGTIRVLQYKFEKGQRLPMHSHPAKLAYALTSVKLKSISLDGKAQTIKMKKSESASSDRSSHAAENLKSTILEVELK